MRRFHLTYDRCADIIRRNKGRGTKKIAHNTYLRALDITAVPEFQVVFHDTPIISYTADGCAYLDHGGWMTVTTKDRLNTFGPENVRVFQRDFVWYIDTPKGTFPWPNHGRALAKIEPDGTVS